jgi:hypothetical protein
MFEKISAAASSKFQTQLERDPEETPVKSQKEKRVVKVAFRASEL